MTSEGGGGPQANARRRVLVVDDDPLVRKILTTVLAFEEFDIVEAAGGDEALNEARRDPPDLVMLDVMMPGVDGYAVCRSLKNDPDLQQIPVVMVTALAGDEHRQRALGVGADAYLVKPFSPIELVETLEGLLEE